MGVLSPMHDRLSLGWILLEMHCLRADYHQIITRLSPDYHQIITRLSPDYHQIITRLSPEYHQSGLSPVHIVFGHNVSWATLSLGQIVSGELSWGTMSHHKKYTAVHSSIQQYIKVHSCKQQYTATEKATKQYIASSTQ